MVQLRFDVGDMVRESVNENGKRKAEMRVDVVNAAEEFSVAATREILVGRISEITEQDEPPDTMPFLLRSFLTRFRLNPRARHDDRGPDGLKVYTYVPES